MSRVSLKILILRTLADTSVLPRCYTRLSCSLSFTLHSTVLLFECVLPIVSYSFLSVRCVRLQGFVQIWAYSSETSFLWLGYVFCEKFIATRSAVFTVSCLQRVGEQDLLVLPKFVSYILNPLTRLWISFVLYLIQARWADARMQSIVGCFPEPVLVNILFFLVWLAFLILIITIIDDIV